MNEANFIFKEIQNKTDILHNPLYSHNTLYYEDVNE